MDGGIDGDAPDRDASTGNAPGGDDRRASASAGTYPDHYVPAPETGGGGWWTVASRRGTPESDTDIVLRIRHGHRDAFDDIYHRYADDVFSMCLLVLGETTVARAAAGTAFALVAQTRLSPLSDPTRLRSWLLELARGSALAWSGSPQARAVAVPHGVTPEEILDRTQLVRAPASLREGLARTFDRAATATGGMTAGAYPVDTRNTSHIRYTASTDPVGPAADDKTIRIGHRTTPPPPGTTTRTATATISTPASPTGNNGRSDPSDSPTIIPIPRRRPYAGPLVRQDWLNRPAVTVVASLILAVAGVTAAISWPTAASDVTAHYPDLAYITPTTSGSRHPTSGPEPAPVVVPTVASEFTKRVSSRRTEPTLSEVAVAHEVPVSPQSVADDGVPQGSSDPSSPGTITTLPRPGTTATPSTAPATTNAGAPTSPPGASGTTAPSAGGKPTTTSSNPPATATRPATRTPATTSPADHPAQA
ncbi:RNA polymerase subunit sigma-24 [Frankia sp. Cppng1_Ct_nod]|uniref:RNA polymerase subunit sigma-24 n=1 Tax=Frankia sp. Cppng1_Ct_nod TaxID=2897162 RepID=UPI0010415E18|nr:RNA polymerase subunit sigma-24 [Frankia sp. Cppng1_Ct_nod]